MNVEVCVFDGVKVAVRFGVRVGFAAERVGVRLDLAVLVGVDVLLGVADLIWTRVGVKVGVPVFSQLSLLLMRGIVTEGLSSLAALRSPPPYGIHPVADMPTAPRTIMNASQ